MTFHVKKISIIIILHSPKNNKSIFKLYLFFYVLSKNSLCFLCRFTKPLNIRKSLRYFLSKAFKPFLEHNVSFFTFKNHSKQSSLWFFVTFP